MHMGNYVLKQGSKMVMHIDKIYVIGIIYYICSIPIKRGKNYAFPLNPKGAQCLLKVK